MMKYIRLFIATIGLLMSMEAYSQASLTPPQKKRSHKTQQNYRRNQTGKPGVEISDGHEWVDLGLPSGLKWATCNVGASSPEEYGVCYTLSKSKLDPEKGMSRFFNDNVILCEYGVLDETGYVTDRDIPRQQWGEGWIIPSVMDVEELIKNTIVKKAICDDVSGWLVRSKINGNSMFFPAPPYYEYNETHRYYCMGRSIYNAENHMADSFYINEIGFGLSDGERPDLGFCVRLVMK